MLTYHFVQIQVFHANDEGRKGYLSRNDLKVALVELFGFEPSKVSDLLYTEYMTLCNIIVLLKKCWYIVVPFTLYSIMLYIS